jgi:hypothetical protein
MSKEPQQPEGELAECPCLASGCIGAMCFDCVVKHGMLAQLAHDKATMGDLWLDTLQKVVRQEISRARACEMLGISFSVLLRLLGGRA